MKLNTALVETFVRNNPPTVDNGDGEVRQRIIAVARECFQRYGPRRTTMEDVAAAAGIARPALYRYVSSRDEIIEAVIIQRVEELAEDIRQLFDPNTSFAEALVEVSMASVNAARLDPELQALFETTTGTRIIQVMAGPNRGFHEFVKAFFKDAFAAARAAGELRHDVTDDAIVDWIRGVYMMMILREDLDAEREREMVLNFLLPSLTQENHAAIDLTERAKKAPTRRKVSRGPAASRS
jgi:AcrR family transcriptional regulator